MWSIVYGTDRREYAARGSIALDAFTTQARGRLGKVVVLWNDAKILAEESTS